jgi:hypothetical protein
MRAGRATIVFLVVLAVGLGALALAGSRAHPARAFSLDVPSRGKVAKLADGQRACESPIGNRAPFGGVRIWAAAVGAPGALSVIVSDARGGRRLARGRMVVPQRLRAVSATLDARVRARRLLRLCLVGAGAAPVELAGWRPVDRAVRLRIGTAKSSQQIALVTLEARPRSFLSLVPRIFRRAALFHPGWVGAWTFWALALALLAGAVALGIAVSRVALEEDRRGADE